MHPLLLNQLAGLGLGSDAAPPDDRWRALLEHIGRAYEDADRERGRLERALDAAHREVQEVHLAVARGEAEQVALRRVAVSIAAEDPLEAVFAMIAEEVAVIFDAGVAAVVRFEGGGNGRVVGSWQGRGDGEPVPHVFELTADSASGSVQRTGASARLDEPALAIGAEGAPEGVRARLGAPVVAGDALWGAVVATTDRPDTLPDDAARSLADFAELAGLAVVNAEARVQLAVRASNDPLTGLANHRTFHEHLEAESDRARRHGRELALALFDLDHFKPINDRFGHQIGDQVLAETARRLAQCARPGDLIARVGGEEFAWLLPECDAADALEAAERARRAISLDPHPLVGHITLSGGVCELAQARDAADLYRLADGALYRAKAEGRDVCVRYPPDPPPQGPSG